jgi:hypothetical protein
MHGMMGRMPPSRGRYIAVAVFVLVLTFSPYAHAAGISASGINDPFTDAIQLWSAVFSSLDSFAHQIASAVQLPQALTATPNAPNNLQQPAALAAAAALATQPPSESATTLEGASTTPSTSPEAASDQTTQSPFVKSAELSPKSSAVSANAAPAAPTPASPASDGITQDQFNAGLSALGISLRQLISESASNPVVSGPGAPLSVEA